MARAATREVARASLGGLLEDSCSRPRTRVRKTRRVTVAMEEGEVLVVSCEARSGTHTEVGAAAAGEEEEKAPEGRSRSISFSSVVCRAGRYHYLHFVLP